MSESIDRSKLSAAITGDALKIIELSDLAFDHPEASVFEWFREREVGPHSTNDDVRGFVDQGRHDVGWALAQLFYDQTLKASCERGRRYNVAHPAWGIALAATRIGHASAARHYAMIAQLGDILGEKREYRGSAVHVLSNWWGWSITRKFIEEAQKFAEDWNREDPRDPRQHWPESHRGGDPIYPEALLASHWFPSRKKLILEHAKATPASFADYLLDAANHADAHASGSLFEMAAATLLSATPGFEVRGGAHDASSQTDIVVAYKHEPFCTARLPDGYAIVECKHWREAVGANVVRELGARCLLLDLRLGILVTSNGITGESDEALRDAELERHRLLSRGVHVLVLSASDLKGTARQLRGLEITLKEDLERLLFGERL